MRPLALSTMYFQRWPDQRDLSPFFELGRRLGFQRFELSHILGAETVAAIDPRTVEIAAVHHPCPRPAGFDERARLTSTSAGDRARAAGDLRRSVDTAARLGARSVVAHLGYVEDEPDEPLRRLRFELTSRFLAGQRASPAFEAARVALLEELARREAEPIERAIEALPALVAYATDAGVSIGLETGFDAHELPRPGGMARLLDALGGDGLGAWLDTGHVGAQAQLGLASFDDWWRAVDGRWLGAHLHDIVGLRDHLVPGMGELDFGAILPQLPEASQLSLEVDWYFSPDDSLAASDIFRPRPTRPIQRADEPLKTLVKLPGGCYTVADNEWCGPPESGFAPLFFMLRGTGST